MYIKLVTDYLDETVSKYPNKIGVKDAIKEYSFFEIRKYALKIASFLAKLNMLKKPIAIYLDKSVDCFVSMFGVAYSGNFYTIIDVTMPQTRIEKILSILDADIVITDKKHMIDLRKNDREYKVFLIEDIYNTVEDEILIKKIRGRIIDTDILYVLFTSGSTGEPKGVIISHRNVITYMEWSGIAFGFDENTIFGNQTPFYFSMSVLDVFQTVRSAAKLVIIPKKLFSLPGDIITYIDENKINTIYWVPSALCQLANMGVLKSEKLKGINKILFAGEVMPAKQLNMWRHALPGAFFANLFGPTEVTDICTYYILDREISDDESVPIGSVCDNMNIFIVDENGNEVFGNDEGEMLVRGSSVSYGYYRNPEKTREVFVQNPIQQAYNEIVYRTGDIVRYNDLGEIIYISRKDFQIKHMGYRIELGEIEAAVSSLDGIDRVCCLYDSANSRIVLFYSGETELDDLKRNIRNKVPKYMVPSNYQKLEEMPLNLNGKIDRNYLKTLI